MDRLIKRFDSIRDADLRICEHRGIAYQKDMSAGRVSYNEEYLAKCQSYEDNAIAKAVNAGRCAMIERIAGKGVSLLDIGAASGAFLRGAIAAGFNASGFDVIPQVSERLRSEKLYAENASGFDVVTMWDVIEHMEDPEFTLRTIRKGSFLFVSIPVFEDLHKIRESKHYRPGEHLYYWTTKGFIDWIALYGFRLIETSDHEIEAGRESIGAFAFCKDLPDESDYIAAYDEIHSTRHYGSSAVELHLRTVANVVRKIQPRSILDYGCGRGDLASHFWLDGTRQICRYDPAIPKYKKMPDGQFDLVFCCDVLEHIPMSAIDKVLNNIRDKSARAIFTISTKLARAKLPSGENAHITLLTQDEWLRWITEVFGSAKLLKSEWEHELIVFAGDRNYKPSTYFPCPKCGGEVQLESFEMYPRPIEWFMHCRDCRYNSESAPTQQGAKDLYAEGRPK